MPLPAPWIEHFRAVAETWVREDTGLAILTLDVTGDGHEELFVAPIELSGGSGLHFRVYSPIDAGRELRYLGEIVFEHFGVRYDDDRRHLVTSHSLPTSWIRDFETWHLRSAFDSSGVRRVGRQRIEDDATEEAARAFAAWRRTGGADLVRVDLSAVIAALADRSRAAAVECSSLWWSAPCAVDPLLDALDRPVAGEALRAVAPIGARSAAAVTLDSLLGPAFAGRESGGVVLVARGGEILYQRAWGMADIALGAPMRPDQVMAVGSITKQMTAAAVLRLVATGAVGLGDDVRVHVPEADTGGRAVTVEQVLTHTAGLPNLVDRDDFERLLRLPATALELLGLTRGRPLHFEPGTGFRYSDSGYILLGELVERVGGVAFGRHLEERLFRPLGMRDTWYGAGDRVLPRRARGYSVRDAETVEAAPFDFSVAHGAGAVVSTAGDLLRWSRALVAGEVLPPDLLQRAWTARRLADGTLSGYGYGWQICTLDGLATLEHGGYVPGFSSNALRVPEADLDVVVLLNNDTDPAAGRLARAVARSLLGGSPAARVQTLDGSQRSRLAGRYRTASGTTLEVSDSDGTLRLRRDTGRARALAALTPLALALDDGDDSVVYHFEVDGVGRAHRMRPFLRCEPGEAAVHLAAEPATARPPRLEPPAW